MAVEEVPFHFNCGFSNGYGAACYASTNDKIAVGELHSVRQKNFEIAYAAATIVYVSQEASKYFGARATYISSRTYIQ